jgi:hypothetical protein
MVRLLPLILLSTNWPTNTSFSHASIRPVLLMAQPVPPYQKHLPGVSSSNASTNCASILPITPYQPPPPPPPTNSSGFNLSTAVGYSSTADVPPPPESNYRGAEGGVGASGGYGTLGALATGPSRVGNTMNVYDGAEGAAGVYGSQTALGAPGMGGGMPQAPPSGTQSGY